MVILPAALQHPQPGLLDQILDVLLPPEQVDQVADQATLIAIDQPVEQCEIALPQALRDPLRFQSGGLCWEDGLDRHTP